MVEKKPPHKATGGYQPKRIQEGYQPKKGIDPTKPPRGKRGDGGAKGQKEQ